MRVLVVGAGAGGAATAVQLSLGGHEVSMWSRSDETLAPFRDAGGVRYDGVLGEGLARVVGWADGFDMGPDPFDAAVVALPVFAHESLAASMASANWPPSLPVVLNPGHTGGALEFRRVFEEMDRDRPPIAELSTLTFVARKYRPDTVTISGVAGRVRGACLPGDQPALEVARALFSGVEPVEDVLASGLCNVNMVLHPPGAVLAAAWVEATGGRFSFYGDAMTSGVEAVMIALDRERREVASVFGHLLPDLIAEMRRIGTVGPNADAANGYAAAIAAGEANRRIAAPNSLSHRYYREDFGYGLVPFLDIAAIAGTPTPIAAALRAIGATATSDASRGRDAAAMGIAGLSLDALLGLVRST